MADHYCLIGLVILNDYDAGLIPKFSEWMYEEVF